MADDGPSSALPLAQHSVLWQPQKRFRPRGAAVTNLLMQPDHTRDARSQGVARTSLATSEPAHTFQAQSHQVLRLNRDGQGCTLASASSRPRFSRHIATPICFLSLLPLPTSQSPLTHTHTHTLWPLYTDDVQSCRNVWRIGLVFLSCACTTALSDAHRHLFPGRCC